MSDFLIRFGEIMLGLFSFAGLIALWEWRRTTKRLKKYVTGYVRSVEFEWQNQTEEFALMDRVRVFEILLRRVQAMHPQTPGANRRVEEVRDVLEQFHSTRRIFREEHLPLRRIDEFPTEPNCSAPGSLDTSLSHAAGLIEIAACHA